MRIALLSDVHANLVALEQVIADARQQGADEFWFLGDLLGYGPQPKECIFFLEDLPVAPECWLSGNHDYAIALFVKLLPKLTFETPTIDRLGVNDPEAQLAVQLVLDQAGQRAAAIQAGELSPLFGARMNDYRDKFPMWQIAAPRVCLAHGVACAARFDPKNVIGGASYLREHARANASLNYLESNGQPAHLLIVGHSHIPFFWRANRASAGYKWSNLLEPMGGVGREFFNHPDGISLDNLEQHPVVMNPGSVGQPRDHDPRAGYALLDLEANKVWFRRVEYDVSKTQQIMRAKNYPEALITRLEQGQ